MSDRDPIVLRRMLALRQFPLFGGVELDELATLAENVIEVLLPAGALLAAGGEHLSALHFIVEGKVESPTVTWGPREVVGVLESLARREPAARVISAAPTLALRLSGAELTEVLEDNFGVLLSVLHELAGHILATDLASPRQPLHLATSGPLGLVERLIVLRSQVPFARARLQALAMLANASEELTLPVGTTVVRANDPATRAMIVVEGTLQLRGPGSEPVLRQAGEAIGLFETLARTRHRATVEVVTPVRALASSGAALFDVLEDHTDLGLAMLATFADALLDAPPRPAADDLVRAN